MHCIVIRSKRLLLCNKKLGSSREKKCILALNRISQLGFASHVKHDSAQKLSVLLLLMNNIIFNSDPHRQTIVCVQNQFQDLFYISKQ